MIENICFSAFQAGWGRYRVKWLLESTFPSFPLPYEALGGGHQCFRCSYLIYSQRNEFTEMSQEKK